MILLKKFKSIYKLLLISILATFASLSQVNAMDGKKFIEVGIGLAGGHSDSRFTASGNQYGSPNLDETYKLDLAVGLQSEIKNIKVDYILNISARPFDSGIGTVERCTGILYTCEFTMEKIIELGIKGYLPVDIAGIAPAIYIGAASAQINLDNQNTTDNRYRFITSRAMGAALGISLNKDLSDTKGISLDYKQTWFDRVSTPASNGFFSAVDSTPVLQALTLRYKIFF